MEIMTNEWLELNAKLQKKKNSLRRNLAEKGVLQKGGRNVFDKYSYFSEAQYKELFTELFAVHGLELSFTELEYGTFEGTEKQSNGRNPRLEFRLYDVDTGFFESTVITGEGMDKGDKAGYKAYTGALKYFLANTFMVATGDDPEKDSPEAKMNKKVEATKINAVKAEALVARCAGEGVDIKRLLALYKVADVRELTEAQYANLNANWDKAKKVLEAEA